MTPVVNPRFNLGEMVARKINPESRCQIVALQIWADTSFRYIISDNHEDNLCCLECELVRWDERFEWTDGEEDVSKN